jgi:glycerophosphoryl diester phosphodiesterase
MTAPSRSGSRPVERIGHRGAPREFPENTLPAFERALERGADAIELDVHATSDSVVVVHHDPVIGRCSNPAASGRALATLSWREVSEVQLAADITVPSLAQVLNLVGSRAKVYVEIKGAGIESAVARTIADGPARCAVHSFDHSIIARMANVAPNLPRGILFDSYPQDVWLAMRDASALDVWPRWSLIDQALVRAVHDAGGRVIAWTVNDAKVAARLIAQDVDALCTDDVRLLDRVR